MSWVMGGIAIAGMVMQGVSAGNKRKREQDCKLN